MEETLKTLKDLTPVKTGKYELLKLNCGKDFVPIDELKVEAVKRAKQCIRNIKDKHYKTFNKGRLWEIMDFNNLTPEDLQEEK